MTFREYLQKCGIDKRTEGPELFIYEHIKALAPEITYREGSLLFADLPDISDMFEALWYGYENELDRQNYEREHTEPEDVYTITGRVMDMCQIKRGEKR